MKYILLTVSLIIFSFTISAQYYTGQKVFASKFPQESVDLSMDTYLQINNSNIDMIVAIENVRTGKVIQHAYINSEDTYKFKNIPVGKFVCKYMWTDKFGNKNFQKDDAVLEYKENEYGGYVITMQKSVVGNLTQSSISENDFFN
tara:strand:+ start:1205 stop:1639 length:435 start_codon:yes stop_codon:yes gene_type:complete